jgi:choline dehydrogenase-like flavoprotein
LPLTGIRAGSATDEAAQGIGIQSDDELLDWIRITPKTTYHPIGTCKMGSDPLAVVDKQLGVHGTAELRVAMPRSCRR